MENENKIVYTTTGAFVIPYEPGQCQRLEFETSDFDKIYHKQIPHTGFYNPKLHLFATYRIYPEKMRGYFPGYKVLYAGNDNGCHAKPFNMNVLPNKYQQSALTQLMAVNGHEAYINIPTASGKTVLAVSYVSMLGIKTFIMCYSSRILEQWKETFESKTDIDPKRVCVFSSSKMMYDFYTEKEKSKDYDVFLCTTTMFDSFGGRYGYELYMSLFKYLGIGLKIIDEAHTRLGSTIRCNAYTSVNMTLYLSADYNQANSRLMHQFMSVFRTVPVIKLEKTLMDELRHIRAVTIGFTSSPNMNEHLKVTGNKYHWSNIDYCRYEFEKGEIQKAILFVVNMIKADECISAEYNRPYKVLILLQLIEHVELVYDLLKGEFPGRSISTYYASTEDKTGALNSDVIISTYKSFSTGLDVTKPQIQHVISTCPVDVVTANQSAGRCRPIEGVLSYFWMLQDFSFEHCSYNNIKVVKYLKTNKIGDTKMYTLTRGELRE